MAVETMKKYAEEFEELTLVLFGEHSVQVTVQSLLYEFAEALRFYKVCAFVNFYLLIDEFRKHFYSEILFFHL